MFILKIFGLQELRELAESNSSVNIFKFNTTDFDALPSLPNRIYEFVGDEGLDVLINNAGTYLKVSLLEGSSDDMMENFKVNTVAPLMITRSLFSLLRKAVQKSGSSIAPVVVNITSKMGSIDDNTGGGHYAYRTSKTGMCIVLTSSDFDLNLTIRFIQYSINPSVYKNSTEHGHQIDER